MGYTKIWVHLVWAVKSREPLLTKEVRQVVVDHIREIGALAHINYEGHC